MMDNSWAERVVAYLTQLLPKENLEEFRESLASRSVINSPERVIIEFDPPQNGIAYSCAYRRHTIVSDGGAKSSYADVEQFWDKDGNCIGFMFQGRKHMFDKENLVEQGRDNIAQRFRDGQVRVADSMQKSEMSQYLEQHPDAVKTPLPGGGWQTELPEDAHPELKFPFQRIRMWNKDGKPGPYLKGMQKEM